MSTLLQPQDFQLAAASKYIAAAGLVFVIYDHVISFSDEVELIWKAKWTLPKVTFLLLRYTVPCVLIVHTYKLAGLKSVHNPNSFCQAWFNITVCLGMATIAVGNFLVLLRLWVIRNRNRIFIFSTLIVFVLAHVATITCVTILLINVTPSLMFFRGLGGLGMCIIARRSILGILYVPAVIFNALALAATIWNAIGRPRREGTSLMQYLRQDGFIFVLLLFLMQVINFFTTLLGPLHIIFPTIYVIWATTTVTTSWLALELRRNGRSAKDTELNLG